MLRRIVHVIVMILITIAHFFMCVVAAHGMQFDVLLIMIVLMLKELFLAIITFTLHVVEGSLASSSDLTPLRIASRSRRSARRNACSCAVNSPNLRQRPLVTLCCL
eukprot:TRINITY_DN118695_c0_g1_i1.p1 TRINITY_DN118695_c0_g1~~TRINITY_DN118695_c0_g1_i1.p1  ORF type:complete len:106 (+),score=7.06 TRINITY_DN118695_c0_g1_i1:42-359(+)